MTIREFKELAMSFPNTVEAPHFDRTAFKVADKRIFATLHEESGKANLKFSKKDQDYFCSLDKKAIYPVPNKWGIQGWTTFELHKLSDGIMVDALESAFKEVFNIKKKKK